MFDRLIQMIGTHDFQVLQGANIFLIGLGGVGGYAFEVLVRSGIQSFTICDFDTFEESNCNRQILATSETIGSYKVDEAKNRALRINSSCNIEMIREHFTIADWKKYDFSNYDFIIDACDDVLVKKELILSSFQQNVPMISCMGTGNRMHPELLEISCLSQTFQDPLARKMRQLLRKENEKYLQIPVVWSKEKPTGFQGIGTICTVPMVAGSYLASYAIQTILNKKKEESSGSYF